MSKEASQYSCSSPHLCIGGSTTAHELVEILIEDDAAEEGENGNTAKKDKGDTHENEQEA